MKLLSNIAETLKSLKRALTLVFILLAGTSALLGQTTKVKGRVTDASTGEGIPFASVYFKGTTIGISTDIDGYYNLETRENVEFLRAEMLSYEPGEVKVVKGGYKEINFSLKPQANMLKSIVVKPNNHYINWILRNIERAKRHNNPEQQDSYECDIYNKMELDLTNADKQIRSKLLRKNFGFVFDYMDTSVISGQPYLPIMISETSSHFYKRKDPSASKEVIKASKISGVQDESTLAQFTGNMHVKTNFYDSFINLFDVQLPSPIAGPNVFYDYYLIDSLMIDGRKTYKIRFHPGKGISSPAFDGEMQVDAQEWAVREIHVKLKKGSNVNWIRDLVMDAEYQRLGDSSWFYKQDKLYADFSITMRDSSRLMSFLGHRQIDYMNPRYGIQIPKEIDRSISDVIMQKDVLNNDEEYWQTVRPYALTEKESNIYKMVDSIKNVPLYKDIYTIIYTLFNGFYETRYVGYGPYFKVFSFNNLEGARFQLGVRTNEGFHKKLRLYGYAAYGVKDHRFKGGGTVEYVFNNQPQRKLILGYKRDVVQLGTSSKALTESNIMNSLLSKGNNQSLSPINEGFLTYMHEWNNNVNQSVTIANRRIYSNKYVPMFTPDSTHVTSVASNELTLTTRLSWRENVTRGVFEKHYISTKYPVVTINLTGGIKGLGSNTYNYFRAEGQVNYKLQLPPVGISKFILSGGKIIGKVPYPLLKLHEGNGTYFYDASAFSCMDFYEFASDTWVTLFYEHNFKGFFLGKIPLMKRLQWREIFTLKAAYGTLSKANNGITNGSIGNPGSTVQGTGVGALYEGMRAPMLFPEGMGDLRKPYIEMGVGISNIFRVFRVDVFWRCTHRTKEINGVKEKVDHRMALNFGIELRF